MSLTKVFRKAARLLVVGAMLLGAGVPTVLAKSDTEWFDDATDLMGKKKYAEAAAAFRESINSFRRMTLAESKAARPLAFGARYRAG